jgi:alpha 1,2-mannosyltransferase
MGLSATLGSIRDYRDASGEWDGSFYYTNFEVSSTSFWRSEAYSQLFRALDDTGGFYLMRWGDAPVHLLAVSLFLPPHQVLRLEKIPYWHQTLVVI